MFRLHEKRTNFHQDLHIYQMCWIIDRITVLNKVPKPIHNKSLAVT